MQKMVDWKQFDFSVDFILTLFRPLLLCVVSYEADIHRLIQNDSIGLHFSFETKHDHELKNY